MNRRKLAKLRKRIDELRKKGSLPSATLERLAKALGRKRHKGGKEPMWVSELLPSASPLSIPHHSKGVGRFTAKSILDQLETDIDALEVSPDVED